MSDPIIILGDTQRSNALDQVRAAPIGAVVSILDKETTTNRQQRTAQMWYQDIARFRGDISQARTGAECKLMFAVGIKCSMDPLFNEVWQDLRSRHTYERLVDILESGMIPVTRDMNVKPMSQYLDTMFGYWTMRGALLRDPELLKERVL